MSRERIAAAKTVVIYNGVDDLASRPAEPAPSETTRPEPGRPTAVCIASLRPKKGHAHLLEAFRQVVARVPAARLLIVGEGPLRDELRRLAARLGLDGTAVFTGYRPDVADLLRAADLFVLASREEGMPNALLEAMSAGLPSVVTNVGGVPEVVEEGRTGYLVPPADPAAMAQRLATLLEDPQLRSRMGVEARLRFEASFTLQRMVAAYESLYGQVLAG